MFVFVLEKYSESIAAYFYEEEVNKMRKSCKKLLGILLAVVMAVTMIPLQGAAAEQQGAETGSVVQTDMAAAQEQMGNVFGVTQDNGREAPSYDINMPVIESFDFAENGQSLTVDDTLHFTMSAYDADSEIRSIYVEVVCENNGHGGIVWLEKNGEGNLYTGEYSCSKLEGNRFYISNIYVKDMFGNYNTWDTWDSETEQYRYTFTLDYTINIDNNVTVSNFRMQTNPSNEDGKLRPGDTVTYTADVRCEDEKILSCNADVYAYYGHSLRSEWMDVYYDNVAQTLTGTFRVTDKTYPTEWYLGYLSVRTESGKSYSFHSSSIEPEADLRFEVVQEDFDTEPPVIESITVDKNRQFVKAGDVVTLTVKVKEEHPREYASAQFSHQVTNVSAFCHVDLTFNADTSTYVGTISITEDMYPCEWALTDLWITDENENDVSLYEFQQDYQSMLPWYFKVKSGNTYREDVKTVTFDFYGYARQENGSYQANSLISSQTVEHVGRRTTLKDLGVSFPQPIEGVTAEWRYGDPWWIVENSGTVIDENIELLFNSTSDMTYNLTASYDKVCANVSLTYLTKDSGIKTVVLPQFVEEGVTYRNVLDASELPEDADTEQFAGFGLSHDYLDENTKIEGECCWIEARAKYSNCQVAWNLKYVGKDGKKESKVINKSYPIGTKISDVLAELEAPKHIAGLEFESWILSDSSMTEISEPMANLDAVALYNGKTTLETVCTYRGESGKIVSDSGMYVVDGKNPSDAVIQEAIDNVTKEVNHFKGLKLSEWKKSIGVNQSRYKMAAFQAVYQNCVVTLKYPDGTSQYIVVDRNTQYTLPTENEKYKDIVWKGYAKGETVTIKEDTEFIAEDFKIQDGKQGGVKLSEDEIARIIQEIENAEAGTTLTIKMNKATVVPKEVLEAIQGKDISIVLDMGAYRWTIGGTEVLASKLRDIDLEVKSDTDEIPTSLISSLAGGKPTTQISLTHNGEFGFRADLTLNLGSENNGGTGNLYYYDSSGKLIFMNSGKIGSDGSTSLSFSHASDYVIVINKALVNKKNGGRNPDITKKDSNLSTDSSYRKSPKTGE